MRTDLKVRPCFYEDPPHTDHPYGIRTYVDHSYLGNPL